MRAAVDAEERSNSVWGSKEVLRSCEVGDVLEDFLRYAGEASHRRSRRGRRQRWCPRFPEMRGGRAEQ